MAASLTRKILEEHLVEGDLKPGEPIALKVDQTLLQDATGTMAGYPYEIACPEIVEVRLEGALDRPWVQAKDIILELLRRLSASGGKNKVFEFTGPGTADLSLPERATIANMIA